MNKVVVGAAALVVVAGGGVAFASLSGAKVVGELQSRTAEMLAPFPGVKVVQNSVSKGLFTSVHTVTLDIGCAAEAVTDAATVDATDAAASAVPASVNPAATEAPAARKPVQITWRDTVRHGPLPGGKGVGLATIDTEIVLPPEAAAQVAKLFGDKPFLSVHTALGFGGSYVSDIKSPPFKYAEQGKGDIDWQGLQATVRGSLSGGVAAGGTYTFEAPGLSVNFVANDQVAGNLRIGKMALQGEVLPHADGSLLMAPSKGTGGITSMQFAFTQRGEAGAKPINMVFENLQFASDAKIDNGLWSGVSKVSGKGRVDDFAIDKVDMQVSLSRIHAATYQTLVGKMMKTSFNCKKPGDEAAEAKEAAALAEDMQKGLNDLLVHNPEYALDRLAVELGGKTAEVSYRFGTKGMTEADAAMPLPALLTTKAYGNASFKVQTGWIEQVVKKAVTLKPLPEGASADTMVATTMGFVNATVDSLVTQGYLAREGDAVTSKAAFDGGMLKVNDKPMNVPLGMLAQ
jgi:uncharacterized protein YdgA (DUF945 family)